MTLKTCPVVFNQEEHTYVYEGKILQGITPILSAVLFPDKYSGIPQFILDRAASHGTLIHQGCELADSLGVTSEIAEVNAYLSLKKEHSLTTLANEYLVSDLTRVASSIDVVFDDFSIADIKTTSQLDLEYLSWQLSIYAYLFELQNGFTPPRLYAIWLRGDKAQLQEVVRHTSEEVIQVIDHFFAGDTMPVNTSTVPEKIFQMEDYIINLESQIKELDNKHKELTAGLLQMMTDSQVKTWETPRMRLTRKDESQRTTFDSKAFSTENPELFKKYQKTQTVKPSLLITLHEKS